MANTPPSRSYRFFSGVACACALTASANTVIGAVVNASPATTLRLVIKLETDCAAVTSLARALDPDKPELDDCMGTSLLTAIRPCRASVRDLMQRSVRGSRKSIG